MGSAVGRDAYSIAGCVSARSSGRSVNWAIAVSASGVIDTTSAAVNETRPLACIVRIVSQATGHHKEAATRHRSGISAAAEKCVSAAADWTSDSQATRVALLAGSLGPERLESEHDA